MYLADLFRSFRPLHNPIGFGVADFVLLALALLLSLAIMLRAALLPYFAKIAERTPLAMGFLAGLTIVLRLALFRLSPAPTPAGADDFSYLLLADTLRHFRLANATHPFHQFFEAVFVLQQPTYSSIYPAGQGLILALCHVLFGSFWAGVLLSAAALSALCYWMLRGWTSPRWALAGGLLAVIQFGPLNQWTNSYWGGAVSACAGCLVFGALPRLSTALETKDRRAMTRNGLLLGAGCGLQLLTRPFECVLLSICVLLYFLLILRASYRHLARPCLFALLAVAPALTLTILQNKSVTGNWTSLPYMLSRYQYGVPATFTFQPNALSHRALTPEQELDYRAQAAIHGPRTDSLGSYFSRLWFRLRYLRFFLLAPLYLAVIFFLPSLRIRRWIWLAASIAIFLAGTNFYPYFFPHYLAALTSLFVLAAIKGLQNLARLNPANFPAEALAAQMLVLLCVTHFLFWYGLQLTASDALLPATAYETWDFLNSGDPDGRIAVHEALTHSPGQQLIFVRYSPQHRFHEWIANSADIDSSKIVMARDLGPEENEKLIHYFPARKLWLLEPDARPPKLSAYSNNANPFEPVN